MSRSKKIFISHSTKTEENLVFLNQVCDALEGDFEVLVDRRTLNPSDLWHSRILEWMYECDAVVILLSERALNASPWVKAEATVSSVRSRNEKDFKLIVVPLDGVNGESIEEDAFFGGVAKLQDFQFVQNCACFDSTVSSISEALANLRSTKSPFEYFTTLIQQTLDGISNEVLEVAINHLNCHELPRMWEGRCRADILARALLRSNSSPLENLRILLERLAHIIKAKEAYVLLEVLKGVWVKPEAGAQLEIKRERGTTVSLNSIELADFTGHCYARSAWPYPSQVHMISSGNEFTLSAIKQALIDYFAKSVANERRAERRLQLIKEPIILMFPPPELSSGDIDFFPDEDLLEQIKKNYPNVTVLLAAGSDEVNQQKIQHLAQPLVPLSDDEENEQYDRYENVLEYIEDQIRLNQYD